MSEPKAARSAIRSLLVWTVSGIGLALLVLLALVAWIALIGVSVDVSPWHQRVETELSQRLARPVRIAGETRIGLSLRPRLVLSDLSIGNPEGFGDTALVALPMATLALATLDLDAWPLLTERRLHVQSLTGSDLRVHLRRLPDGGNNWELPPPAAPTPTPAKSGTNAASKQMTLDVDSIRIEKVAIDYDGGNGQAHYFDLSLLQGQARRGAPVRFTLQGAVEKTFPYELQILGGELSALQGFGQPFPLEATLNFVGSAFNVSGTLTRQPRGIDAQMSFGLGTPDLAEIERLLGTTLPKVGATALAGSLSLTPGRVRVASLIGSMGETTLAGDLTIDLDRPRPRVSGNLTLPTLDMRPFLKQKTEVAARNRQTLSQWYADIGRAGFSLDQLNAYDAEVELGVQKWLSLPGDVDEVRMQVSLQQGRLVAPVSATVEGVALTGRFEADGSAYTPSIDLALETRDSPLGGLARLLFGLPTLRGHLGSFHLRVNAFGRRVSDLVDSLEVQIALARADLSYGNPIAGAEATKDATNAAANTTTNVAANAAANTTTNTASTAAARALANPRAKPGAGARRPVNFRLEWLTMAIPQGAPLHANTTATLLGQPLEANLRADTLARMMQGSAPLELTASSRSARARIVARVDENAYASDIGFQLEAAQASDVAAWVNLAGADRQRGRDASFLVAGNAQWNPKAWSVRNLKFQLGKTRLDGEAAMSQGAPLRARIAFDTIDPAEIETLLARPKAAGSDAALPADRAAGGKGAGLTLDIPILPSGIDLSDTDLQVTVNRISSKPLELTRLSFTAQVRNSRMIASPFSATVLDTAFAGAIALDLHSREPNAELWLSSAGVDVGRLLRQLNLSQTIDAQAGVLRLHAVARGRRLGDLLERSELVGEIEAGFVNLRDANTGALLRMRLDRGELRADAGAPITLALSGALEDYPVKLQLSSARLTDLLSADKRVPFRLDASIIDHKLAITGSLARPLSERDIDLSLSLAGDRLNTLSGLARTALPAWGPYALNSKLRLSRRGYELTDMDLRIGSSRLHGSGSFDTLQKPPRITLGLNAQNIQLNDFPFDEKGKVATNTDKKSADRNIKDEQNRGDTLTDENDGDRQQPGPTDGAPAGAPNSFDPQALRQKAIKASDDAQRLFSPELLGRQNLTMSLSVERVLSGQDRLGNGRLRASIENGRAQIGPIEVEIPGGSARAQLAYQPGRKGIDVESQIALDRFDYGIIARRLRPQANISGRFSLDMNVRSSAPSLSQALLYGNGNLDFMVWPQSLQAGIFDLWAANLFIALANKADPSASSRINCGIGRFTLSDGVFRHRQLLIDTSRVRVSGAGQADMRAETVDLVLRPLPKSAQFFSLATPISVSGSIEKPQIGTAPGAIFETLVRLGTSLVWVPIQKLFGKELAENGADVCGDQALSRSAAGPAPNAAPGEQ